MQLTAISWTTPDDQMLGILFVSMVIYIDEDESFCAKKKLFNADEFMNEF